jgi:sporulation protein YlmC with PRC-barrel domain
MKLEDLRLHADIVSADGHKIGHLSRFVFEPATHKLTHIVVDTGILRSGEALWKGGWGLSHDRIVPIGVLDRADSHAVHITMTGDEFRDLSHDYLEEYFKPLPDLEKGEPDLSDIARFATSIPGEPGPYMMQQQTALPPNEAEVGDDAPVWRLNPHKKVGEVERVLFDEASGKIDALVIRRGFLFSKEVVLPIDSVVEVVGGIVRVQMTDEELHALAEYHPED